MIIYPLFSQTRGGESQRVSTSKPYRHSAAVWGPDIEEGQSSQGALLDTTSSSPIRGLARQSYPGGRGQPLRARAPYRHNTSSDTLQELEIKLRISRLREQNLLKKQQGLQRDLNFKDAQIRTLNETIAAAETLIQRQTEAMFYHNS